MSEIRTQLSELQRAEASMGRIDKLVQRKTRIVDGPISTVPDGPLSAVFDNVSFAYNDEVRDDVPTRDQIDEAIMKPDNGNAGQEIVLQNVSFILEPGRVLGLLGRTGSGKTTLARLLIRFHDPTVGEIRLGEKALPSMQIATLRAHVGLVTQEVQLFQGTIRDNLTFFDSSIPDEKLYQVFDTLDLTPWLTTQPDGLDTVLASGGGGLSAGQAQLLALARIFLLDPGLIILDEASSRLDPMTEMLMERAMDRLLENRTAIIIAHHLGTVNRADDVMILDRGVIVEYGDRLKLGEDNQSHFHGLLKSGMEEMLA
ncbi:MAG: ABC transporter ATP-binding protein [Anaerolineae bacterium]|nr:ABC transporter ATP-binding protein [Anaerolineae bacterium]